MQEEALAINNLANRLDDNFERALSIILSSEGRLVLTGVGKSGHIARKAASTFASTGTPSFFVNPVDCLHGDFGMLSPSDVMLIISKSGESREISEIVAFLHRFNIPLIAICNESDSFLSSNSTVSLLTQVSKEACPLNLAPTTSTTVALALTDAIAVCLMNMRGFKSEDFAVFHPAGSLGKQLTPVKKIMHTGQSLPITTTKTKLKDTLALIMEKKLGVAIVINEEGLLEGIITDGDFKRLLAGEGAAILEKPMSDIMTKNPKTIGKDALIADAISAMEGKVTSLIVVEDKKPIGIIHIHDILKYKAI